ncbi:MAG: hypothetical protein QW303_06835 [Nitrososphaerota archaeon]
MSTKTLFGILLRSLSLTFIRDGRRRMRRMKVVCPICNQAGILETRGNSRRVIHYQWVNNKQIFIAHRVDSIKETLNIDMVTEKPISLVSDTVNSSSFSQAEMGRTVCN